MLPIHPYDKKESVWGRAMQAFTSTREQEIDRSGMTIPDRYTRFSAARIGYYWIFDLPDSAHSRRRRGCRGLGWIPWSPGCCSGSIVMSASIFPDLCGGTYVVVVLLAFGSH